MKTIMLTLIFVLSFILFLTTNIKTQAQVDTTKDLYEMDLSELLNLEVTTVSKRAQSSSEAPAIVTIITSDQIENYGVQSLSELMSLVPGFTVADSYWKNQIVTSRGIKMTLYNDKILMLINGIPAYDAASLEYYLDVIPITSIKQIEIIRGPGSTLYGTNAFSAVINIITKNGKDKIGAYSYLKGGSFGTKEIGLSLDNKIKNLNYHIGATLKDDQGYKKYIAYDEKKNSGDAEYEHDNDNLFTSINYKNFTINAGYMYLKYFKYGPLPALIYSNNSNIGESGRTFSEKMYVNSIFDAKINEKLSTKISLHWDFSDHQADLGNFGVDVYQNSIHVITTTTAPDYYRFSGYLFQGEGQIGYKINDKLSLLTGIAGESRTTTHLADLYSDLNGTKLFEGSTKKLPFSVQDFGGFAQLDGNINKFGYVVGLRTTYIGVSKKAYLTPRAGLVYSLSSNSSLKLLYGEAFRGPGPQEQYYKVPMLIYGADAINVSLKPERIKTYEFSWEQTIIQKLKFKINGFYTNILDAINRRGASPAEIAMINQPGMTSTSVYDNVGKQNIKGFEAEFNGYPANYFNFFINFSYKDGDASDIPAKTIAGKDTILKYNYIPFMEKITANAGFSLKYAGFTLSPIYQYIGSKEGPLANNAIAPYVPLQVYKTDAYGLLHIVLSYQFTQNLNISLSARNVLNKEYFYPEEARRRIPNIPGGYGRAFFVKVSYGFNKIE